MKNPNSIKIRYPKDSRLETASGSRIWLNGEELRYVSDINLDIGAAHVSKITITLLVKDVDIQVERPHLGEIVQA